MQLILLALIYGIIFCNAQYFVADHNDLLDGDMTISTIINTEVEQVRIVMSGPANTWFGIGFGNTIMDGTYSIVAFQVDVGAEFGTIPIVEEVILGPHFPGVPQRNQTLSILADIIEGDRRTVVIQRTIDGVTYSFPTVSGSIDIIAAKGFPNITDFTTATGMNSRVVTSLDFEEIDEDPIATPVPSVPIDAATA